MPECSSAKGVALPRNQFYRTPVGLTPKAIGDSGESYHVGAVPPLARDQSRIRACPVHLELVEPRLKPWGAEALSYRLDQTVRFMAYLVELAARQATGRP